MDIKDSLGYAIGELSYKTVYSINDLICGKAEDQVGDDIRKIMQEISLKVKFPAIQLTLIQSYEEGNCRKSYGSKAMNKFFKCVKNIGFTHAIAQVGKIGIGGSLERSIKFYESCGWVMCQQPNAFSLKFAYYEI